MTDIAKDNVTKKIFGQTHHKQLTIDQIEAYDRNPRRTINPRYHDIKLAIRAAGKLNTALSVTRRPGATLYMVESGGNTRLQILKELWQETKDERYYKTDCLIVPWQSESHVLSAHLIENELRGEMTLIDKALALKDLKVQLENESGKTLSRNEFSKKLALSGYPVSPRQLTRFNYAADFLASLIPMALEAGLGVRAIDKIMKFQTCYSKCLAEFGGTQPFEPMLAQALAQHDDDELDINALQRTLDDFIVSCTGERLNKVRTHVDVLLIDNNDDRETWDEQRNHTVDIFNIATQAANNGLSLVQPISQPEAMRGGQNVTLSAPEPKVQSKPDSQPGNNQATVSYPQLAPLEAPLTLNDLPLLRDQCYDLVQQLSNIIPLLETVTPWEQGYGFYMELPEQAIQNEITYQVYWFLLGLSGQNLSSSRIELAKERRFAQLLIAEQDTQIGEYIGSPARTDLLVSNALLAKQLPDAAFALLLQITQLCRRIKLTYRESDIFHCMTLEQTQLSIIMARHAQQQPTEPDGDEDDE